MIFKQFETTHSLPSVYIYGWPIESIDESIYGGLFGNATRAVGLAFNLSKLGHKVFLEVNDDFEDRVSNQQVKPTFVRRSDRINFLPEADVLLISCTNLQTFKFMFKGEPEIYHPNKVYACCFDLNDQLDLSFVRRENAIITFNNKLQKLSWDKRCLGIKSVVIPYGVNDCDYVTQALVDSKSIDVIWIGAFRRVDMLQRVVSFALANPEAKVSVVCRKVFDGKVPHGLRGSTSNPYGDFVNRDPLNKFNALIEELCHCQMPNNMIFLGPMEGSNHALLGRHSVGLDFSRFPAQSHDNTKIMDYLASGLYVICDNGTPSSRFVRQLRHGSILRPNPNEEELVSAYQQAKKESSLRKRHKISAKMQREHGWKSRSIQFSKLIREISYNSR